MAISDSHALLGETIADKYLVESVVGAGGFATVYRARHLVWQRPVAVKVFNLPADGANGEHAKLVDAFLREGALLAELSERSSAICQARDAGVLTTSRGIRLPYLVLEWLEGMSLAEVLESEAARGLPLRTLAEAVALFEAAADALALAHERGIVHRDIKPANLFVLGDPRGDEATVKLLDFGVAKVLADAHATAAALAATVGPPSAFTPYYAAPEQFSRTHGPTGPWTDVYALALVVVELVTGREPQEGKDIAELAGIAADPMRRPTPRTLGASISDSAEAVFRRALSVDPRARYGNVGELWDALRASLGMGPSPTRSAPRSAHRMRARAALASAPTLEAPPSSSRAVVPVDPRTNARAWRSVASVAIALIVATVAAEAFWMRSVRQRTGPAAATSSSATVSSAFASASYVVSSAPSCPSGMVSVPGGPFFMGVDDGTPLERPAHQVRLAPFCIDRFEATVASYKACSDEGECKRAPITNDWAEIDAREHALFDPLCNARQPVDRAQHPINCVDWDMAATYCRSRGARLPSEAEWELAARGPDGRKYPWGDDPPGPALLNACGAECLAWGRAHGERERAMYAASDGWATTAPVGSFPAGASRYGVEDVVGNVWEWVDDWFAPYGADEQKNPRGPTTGTEKVIRGGAWNGAEPSWVRPTFRYKDAPTKRSYGIGFRCAATLTVRP